MRPNGYGQYQRWLRRASARQARIEVAPTSNSPARGLQGRYPPPDRNADGLLSWALPPGRHPPSRVPIPATRGRERATMSRPTRWRSSPAGSGRRDRSGAAWTSTAATRPRRVKPLRQSTRRPGRRGSAAAAAQQRERPYGERDQQQTYDPRDLRWLSTVAPTAPAVQGLPASPEPNDQVMLIGLNQRWVS